MRRLAMTLTLAFAVACGAPVADQAVAPGSGPPSEAYRHPDNLVDDDRFDPVTDSPCRDALDGGPSPGVTVYFTCGSVTAAVTRSGSSERDALDALFAGPTPEEERAGYRSGYDERTADLGYDYDRVDDIGVVNLSPEFLAVEFLFVPVSTFAELVSTVGAFTGVERVAVLVEGRPLCEALEEC